MNGIKGLTLEYARLRLEALGFGLPCAETGLYKVYRASYRGYLEVYTGYYKGSPMPMSQPLGQNQR